MGLNKKNIAISAMQDIVRLDRIINSICCDFADVDMMNTVKHDIEVAANDPNINVDTFLKMCCKLGNSYNAICCQKSNLNLSDPTRRVSTDTERHAVKEEIWKYVFEMFRLVKLPPRYLSKIMSKLLKEEFR